MIDRLDIHAYADGELDGAQRAAAQAAIEASPEATAELHAIQKLKSFVAYSASQPACKTEWQACVKRLNEMDRAHRTEGFVSRYAWALCAVLFVAIGVGGYFRRTHGSSVGTGDVAAYASSLIPIQGPRASQPEQLRSWIADQTGMQTSAQINPARVVGMAVCDQGGRRVVSVRMQDQYGELALMVIPGVTEVEGVQPMGGGMYAGRVNNTNCVTWEDNSCVMLMIGNRDYAYLRALGQSLYR